jgi:hypothetical protein
MKALLFALLLGAGLAYSQVKIEYESPLQVILVANSNDGLVYVGDDTDPRDYENIIFRQLRYTIGQLGWYRSAPQISRLQVQINKTEKLGGLTAVYYNLTGKVAWDRDEPVPNRLEIVLPARADDTGLRDFYKNYSASCNDFKNGVTEEDFFYHYTPLKETCPLATPQAGEMSQVQRMHWELSVGLNTTGKYPEYHRVWEDRKLTVTVLVTKNEPGSVSNKDFGIAAYNKLYAEITGKFGPPDKINRKISEVPGAANPKLELYYRKDGHEYTFHLRLVDSLDDVAPDFRIWYQARTMDSDLVVYNGHSALGSNIEKLASMGRFPSGKYQIYLVNGCGTFSYLNDMLFRKHGANNPGFSASKHLDVVTNALTSYFSTNAVTTVSFISALVNQNETYGQILRKMDPRQRIIVDGEEDNEWMPPKNKVLYPL